MGILEPNAIKIHISNPQNWERNDLVYLSSLKIPGSLMDKPLQVYNKNNEEITSQMYVNPDKTYSLKFLVEKIPARGSEVYYFKERDPHADFHPPEEGLMDGNDYYIENDLFRIVIENDGSSTLMQKIELDSEESTDEKLIIMGEELGAGSIWAGEEFLKYFHFGDFCYNGDIIGWKSVQSSLIEASDFFGTLKVVHLPNEDTSFTSSLETIISIQKGESSLIRFISQYKVENLLKNAKIQFTFPIPFEKYSIWQNENSFLVMDEMSQLGIAFICNNASFEVIESSLFNKHQVVLSPIPTFEQILNHFKIEYAVLPVIRNIDQTQDQLINLIKQYEEEYFTPLDIEIEF